MAKVNPFKLPRPKREPVTKSFTDAEQPGAEVTLTLRRLDAAELIVAAEAAQAQIETWITGGDLRPASQFPFVDGKPVPLTAKLCLSVTVLEHMQCPADAGERYSFNELVALTVTMPNAWQEIYRFMEEVGSPPRPEKGGATHGQAGATSSA